MHLVTNMHTNWHVEELLIPVYIKHSRHIYRQSFINNAVKYLSQFFEGKKGTFTKKGRTYLCNLYCPFIIKC